MTDCSRKNLLRTKKEILTHVEAGKLSIKSAASLLGMTRQGLWKLRLNYQRYGNLALIGRKRGPKSWFRVHNRTPEWLEEKIEKIYLLYGGGPDTLSWIIEDNYSDQQALIELSRSTIYRILVRRRLLRRKDRERPNDHPNKYTKGSLGNVSAGSDTYSDCAPYGCAYPSLVWGWVGYFCNLTAVSANDGDCNGAGACYTSFADSCIDSGTRESNEGYCSSTGCVRPGVCVQGSNKTTSDTFVELCYTSGQNGCPINQHCNSTGYCVVD